MEVDGDGPIPPLFASLRGCIRWWQKLLPDETEPDAATPEPPSPCSMSAAHSAPSEHGSDTHPTGRQLLHELVPEPLIIWAIGDHRRQSPCEHDDGQELQEQEQERGPAGSRWRRARQTA